MQYILDLEAIKSCCGFCFTNELLSGNWMRITQNTRKPFYFIMKKIEHWHGFSDAVNYQLCWLAFPWDYFYLFFPNFPNGLPCYSPEVGQFLRGNWGGWIIPNNNPSEHKRVRHLTHQKCQEHIPNVTMEQVYFSATHVIHIFNWIMFKEKSHSCSI